MHVLLFLLVVLWALRRQAIHDHQAAIPAAHDLMFYGSAPRRRKKRRGFFRSILKAMGMGAIAVTLFIALQALAMVIVSHQI